MAVAKLLMNGGPATVYGARAFAAFREFYDQRAGTGAPSAPGQRAGRGHHIAQPDGHQHVA